MVGDRPVRVIHGGTAGDWPPRARPSRIDSRSVRSAWATGARSADVATSLTRDRCRAWADRTSGPRPAQVGLRSTGLVGRWDNVRGHSRAPSPGSRARTDWHASVTRPALAGGGRRSHGRAAMDAWTTGGPPPTRRACARCAEDLRRVGAPIGAPQTRTRRGSRRRGRPRWAASPACGVDAVEAGSLTPTRPTTPTRTGAHPVDRCRAPSRRPSLTLQGCTDAHRGRGHGRRYACAGSGSLPAIRHDQPGDPMSDPIEPVEISTLDRTLLEELEPEVGRLSTATSRSPRSGSPTSTSPTGSGATSTRSPGRPTSRG